MEEWTRTLDQAAKIAQDLIQLCRRGQSPSTPPPLCAEPPRAAQSTADPQPRPAFPARPPPRRPDLLPSKATAHRRQSNRRPTQPGEEKSQSTGPPEAAAYPRKPPPSPPPPWGGQQPVPPVKGPDGGPHGTPNQPSRYGKEERKHPELGFSLFEGVDTPGEAEPGKYPQTRRLEKIMKLAQLVETEHEIQLPKETLETVPANRRPKEPKGELKPPRTTLEEDHRDPSLTRATPRREIHMAESSTEVSLHSLAGLTSHSTMKMQGNVADVQVVVLVDSGATHNFIASRIVSRAAIPVTNQAEVKVTLGDGKRAQCQGQCRRVTLRVQGATIIQDFLILDMGNTDLILGMQWLQTLGEMRVRWKDLYMEFTQDDRRIVLQGDPRLCKSRATLKSIIKDIQNHAEIYMVEFLPSRKKGEESVEATPPAEIQALLQRYTSVFEMPKGLPPI